MLGFMGVFLPLLPTTPFLLLAVFFSLRSSPAIHSWLLNHKVLGPPLRQYLDQRSISRKVYIRAVIVLWLTMSLSIWIVKLVWAKCLLLVIAISVTVYLARLKI
ncbi:YbaN family protein [Endozoicomonas sp.]|uniref:YbaN family protein n=1 Tax=Endozoicomonas sp. TaxID=1892382 RepID=UPI00288396FB|nr:YbaN family protein [Endozoicomonas sp.]